MESFTEVMDKKLKELLEFVELRQKLLEHFKLEKQKESYVADREQKEREYVR